MKVYPYLLYNQIPGYMFPTLTMWTSGHVTIIPRRTRDEAPRLSMKTVWIPAVIMLILLHGVAMLCPRVTHVTTTCYIDLTCVVITASLTVAFREKHAGNCEHINTVMTCEHELNISAMRPRPRPNSYVTKMCKYSVINSYPIGLSYINS